MKLRFNILITVFLCALTLNELTFAQAGFSPKIDSVINLCTNPILSKLLRELSGDTSTIIGGLPYTIVSRHNNHPDNVKASQFILERFLSFGLNARYMTYRPTGINVLATKTGTKYPNKQYIICGHYDDMPSGPLAPGADDNGSGTCAVLEAARLLAPFSFDYTLIFIAFDEEEQGLIGSHAYADSAFNSGDSILGVINLDMIAWDGNNDYNMNLYSDNNSVPFVSYAKSAFNIYQPVLVPYLMVSNMSGSDHWYFWQRGYKALCGIEKSPDFNPYYHTVNDNFSHVNMNFYLDNTRASIAALMAFGWDYFMSITHNPVTSAEEQVTVTITAVITSPHPINKGTGGPRVYYKVNNGNFSGVIFNYNNLDTFKFTIPGQPAGVTVSYYIAAQDTLGRFVASLPAGGKGLNPPGGTAPGTFFSYIVNPVGIVSNTEPAEYKLSQNFPNPFNPSTNITYSVKKSSEIRIAVTDILGREIIELVNGRHIAGVHSVRFNPSGMASGIYYYSMFVDGSLFDSKKMILIK